MFLVLALVSQLVLWCVIAWSRVRLSVGCWLSCCCVLDFPLVVIIYNSFYLSFILSAGEGESGSVIWSESDLAQ